MRKNALILGLVLAVGSVSAAAVVDPDVARLQARLAQIDSDPQFAGKAGLERLKASQALESLAAARSRQRPALLGIAEHRLRAAEAAVAAELLAERSAELDRERDQILIDASRREADTARREAERLRSRALAQQEEAARLAELAEIERVARAETFALAEQARAEAEQARRLAASRAREAQLAREEAELASALVAEALAADAPLPPSRQVAGATVYTLAGNAFASGRASLTTEANASLRRLAQELAGRRVEVTGFTDSQGETAANLRLSQRRADAVAAILREAGIEATAQGRGEADPVADNATEQGRARNRRVEITVR
ncbi:OmpA family protein [Silanimonas sp.]|uniref:OmpA family protein n=1 Tax=Silanimonas sp. TaxID=1929290 RepID=UPI001BC5B917|nr:OmpA family protein [Silanimonas sp.]MBS3895467.1 OmpA family protein [Silanimonas sp.]